MNKEQENSPKSAESSMPNFDLIHQEYWRANLIVVSVLLLIWFLVSFVFGIILSEELNEIRFYGFRLGFWWAHQGSIFIFVLLIFAYSIIMGRVDRYFRSKVEGELWK